VEEVTQDPHPLVVKGALLGVTAGAAVGAIAVHDLQGRTAVMKGALVTAAAQGGALAIAAAQGGAPHCPREETAAPALMVAGALHQGNAMAQITA